MEKETEALGLGLSATHQEIVHGALQVDDAREHVHVFVRTSANSGKQPSHFPIEESNATIQNQQRQLHAELERCLGILDAAGSNVHSYTVDCAPGCAPSDADLASFEAEVTAVLLKVIGNQAEQLAHTAAEEMEEQAHREYGREQCLDFTGREQALEFIERALSAARGMPYAVLAPSGFGKSAVMAEAVRRARVKHPQAVVLERYLGATPRSTNVALLLHDLLAALDAQREGTHTEVEQLPNDLSSLIPLFSGALAKASAEHPVFLFLDGLSELAEPSGTIQLHWLPWSLPPHVRMVISATLPAGSSMDTDDAAFGVTRVIQRHVPRERQVYLERLSGGEAEQLLERWLYGAKRKLQPLQKAALLSAFTRNGTPLWLRIATIESWHFSSLQALPEFPASTAQLIEHMLRRLAAEENHGALLVARALGYLICSRSGVAEDEMLDLLSSDSEVMADFRRRSPNSPPVATLPVQSGRAFAATLRCTLARKNRKMLVCCI